MLAVALIGFPGAAGAVPIPWKNCGTPADLITVMRADSSIWPPVAGEAVTLDVQFVLSQHIWGGYAVLDAAGQQPPAQVWPRSMGLGPANAGPYNRSVTLIVPLEAGGQVYDVSFDAYGPNGAQLICLQATVPVKTATNSASNPGPPQWDQGGNGPPGDFLWELFGTFLPPFAQYNAAPPLRGRGPI
jgi:hypothetical protein